MGFYPWNVDQKVVVSMLYALAIATGIFRFFYRWYISRFWWEDIWATFALFLVIICFVDAWMMQSPNDLKTVYWMEAMMLTSGLWVARMSMIATIIRITYHSRFRRFAYASALAFGVMWIITLVYKLYMCITHACIMNRGVATFQLVSDVISDTLLLGLPLCFLRGVEIANSQRILLVSSFASSICITIVSILHSIFLILPHSAITPVLAHVKTAISLIICNLLVIVTFAYRLYRRSDLDLSDNVPTKSGDVLLSSVVRDDLY